MAPTTGASTIYSPFSAIHALVLGNLALSTPVLLYAKVAYSLCFQAIEARLASIATFTLTIAEHTAIAVGSKIALVLIFGNREVSFILDLVHVDTLVVVLDLVLVVFFTDVEARSYIDEQGGVAIQCSAMLA